MKTSPQDAQTDIVVYGTTWCPDCRRAKQFLGEQRMQYRWVDIEQDARAMAYVEEVNGGQRRVPTIVFADGSRHGIDDVASGWDHPEGRRVALGGESQSSGTAVVVSAKHYHQVDVSRGST